MKNKKTFGNLRPAECVDASVEFLKKHFVHLLPILLPWAGLNMLSAFLLSRSAVEGVLRPLLNGLNPETGELSRILWGVGLNSLLEGMQSFFYGTVIYYTFGTLRSGQPPSRRWAAKRGIIYFLYGLLLNAIIRYGMSILMLPFLLTEGIAAAVSAGMETSVGATLAVLFVIAAAFLFGIVYLVLRFSLYGPMMAVLRTNVFTALGASFRFTKKRVWSVLLLWLSAMLVSTASRGAVTVLTALNLVSSTAAVSILSAVLEGAASVCVFAVPVACVFAVCADREEEVPQ